MVIHRSKSQLMIKRCFRVAAILDYEVYSKTCLRGPLKKNTIPDLFHVYLNIFQFHFLRLDINKTNKCCFFVHNGRVPGIAI